MTHKKAPLIVGLGGTTQANSSTEKSLRVVLAAAAAKGATTRLIEGPFIARLPIYTPEKNERTPEQRELIEAVREADGLVIATPAYHAGMSGLIKNAIDLLEDLRDDRRPYLDRRDGACTDVKAQAQLQLLANQVLEFAIRFAD
jgi:FMN reductase